MQLSIRSFSEYVQDMGAALHAGSRYVLDLSVGSVLRSLLEAQASAVMWLQVLIADALEASRAGTARGGDLDTWMADFSLTRLPSVKAVGTVTLSRTSTLGDVSVPVGARVRTTATGSTFLIVADSNHARWHSDSTSYVLQTGENAVTVPIVAEKEGTSGNVLAGAIALLSSSIAGIDTVINDQPTTGGLDSESDAALRRRFADYLKSRSRATIDAVGFAIQSVRQGLLFRIYDGVDLIGQPRPGHFIIVVDDGSRSPTEQMIAAVARAVDEVRPVGSTFSVVPPTTHHCDVTCSITLPEMDNGTAMQIRTAAVQAVRGYLLQLGIGDMVPITRIAQVIYSSDSRITNVSNLLINGSNSDVSPSRLGAIVPRFVAVS